MTPIEKLLPCLTAVRASGKDRWMAQCPSHEDKRPSLSVRQFQDGSLSVKCFAGCSTGNVLSAVSLNPSDLFPRQNDDYASGHAPRPGPPWRDLISYLREDLQAIQIGAARLASGEKLERKDLDRVGLTAIRIYELLGNCQ